MKSRILRSGILWLVAWAVTDVVVGGGLAWAGASPDAKCQAGKSKAGGKYASCLLSAEAKLLQTEGACSATTSTVCYLNNDCPGVETCVKDLTKYNDSVTKCGDKIDGTFSKLEAKASDAGDACPTTNDAGAISSLVGECVDEINGSLSGAPSGDSPSPLPATAQTVCYDGAGAPTACAGTGQDGELQVGIARAFTDNGNGTIRDDATGLLWEKLDDNNANGIHDGLRAYNLENGLRKIRVLNGNATACVGSGNPDVCCTGAGTGTCSPFAGFTDWRLPNAIEAFTLVSYATSSPATFSIFHTNCSAGCTTATCSCTTTFLDLLSSTTCQDTTTNGHVVSFGNGNLGCQPTKSVTNFQVRAVRGGN